MNELALFAGAGGGVLASHLMGLRTICAVERDAYAAQVLAQRQNDGFLPPFPIWSDVCSFDGRPWQGVVDVISGGFPCQDISSAGNGAGIDGDRSGLWAEMARIISEVRPYYVFVENSPMLVSRGLTRVVSDLAEMGYDTQWTRFSASNFGAPHIRDRMWIMGYTAGKRLPQWTGDQMAGFSSIEELKRPGSNVSNPQGFGSQQAWDREACFTKRIARGGGERNWWATEPELGRVADGVACRVDRLKAIGNGQVPAVARSAFEYLRES
ncbi:DNA cytosine methyltransferase [Acinetobacter chinensis]|uniref:DNA cytosine methyltransferase n=1 Tax=Acinetobacter chinensis TaxID=2004650 RepID=UPI0029347E60|nr:DNA cytosine methyltransferase [Acinetobacter chinensis]WOE40666.1 DNA cytosine methyltransferase [Acinetobacter chinensis]